VPTTRSVCVQPTVRHESGPLWATVCGSNGDRVGRSGRFSPGVPVMETTQPRHRDHHSCRRWPRRDRSSLRRVFVQGIVNPVLVMVGYVSAKEPAQMGSIDRNNVIEKLAAATTYPPFSESILPRRLDPRPLYFQPRRLSGNP
jgi:hypothetical protein